MVRLSRDATFVRGGGSYGGIRRFRFVYGGGMSERGREGPFGWGRPSCLLLETGSGGGGHLVGAFDARGLVCTGYGRCTGRWGRRNGAQHG
jgi:hypothetical protein